MDVDALRNDNELEGVYIELENNLEAFIMTGGINFTEVNRVTSTSHAINMLLEGDFNLDEIRNNLEELDCIKGEYNGIEVWEGGGLWDFWGTEASVALVSNKLVILGRGTEVGECIKVLKNSDFSIYAEEDFKDVMDPIPSGIMVGCSMDMFVPIGFYLDLKLRYSQ
jgi:hypothetical protein